MPKRTLRVYIQVDDVFVNQIGERVKARWGEMTKAERAVASILIKALNESKQAITKELWVAAGQDVSLDEVIASLRDKRGIPVLVSVGMGGGYRLPLSRAECNLYLQAEMAVLHRKIERIASVYKSMTEYGIPKPEGIDGLLALSKVYKLKMTEG